MYVMMYVLCTDGGAVNGGGGDGGSAAADVLQSSTGRRVKVVRLRQQSSVEDQGATEF